MGEGDEAIQATKGDVQRLHERMDDMVRAQTDSAVAAAQMATALSALKESLDKAAQDRKATCPNGGEIGTAMAVAYALGGRQDPVQGTTAVVHRVDLMWRVGLYAGSLLVAAAVLPSLVWFFRWIGGAIARAVAG